MRLEDEEHQRMLIKLRQDQVDEESRPEKRKRVIKQCISWSGDHDSTRLVWHTTKKQKTRKKYRKELFSNRVNKVKPAPLLEVNHQNMALNVKPPSLKSIVSTLSEKVSNLEKYLLFYAMTNQAKHITTAIHHHFHFPREDMVSSQIITFVGRQNYLNENEGITWFEVRKAMLPYENINPIITKGIGSLVYGGQYDSPRHAYTRSFPVEQGKKIRKHLLLQRCKLAYV